MTRDDIGDRLINNFVELTLTLNTIYFEVNDCLLRLHALQSIPSHFLENLFISILLLAIEHKHLMVLDSQLN